MAERWFENPEVRDGGAPIRPGLHFEASIGDRSQAQVAAEWKNRMQKGGALLPDTTPILGNTGTALETMMDQGGKALANVNGKASGDESLAKARREADTAIGHGVLAKNAVLLQGENVGVSPDLLVDSDDNRSTLETLQLDRDQIIGKVALVRPE